MFMSGQTINAIIRMHNSMVDDDNTLSALVEEFNRANANAVPRIGSVFDIPVILNEN